VIQIQKRSLRALEEHPLTAIHLGVQILFDVGKKRHDLRGNL
jgi:hypothetical protein